jgi:hypothetical protein
MSPVPRVTAGDALAAAGIPSERCGRSRLARLAPAERALYRWVLRQFATRRAPNRSGLAGQAERLALEPEAALVLLAREDLVHLEGSEIMVAYPFSGRPSRHRVRFDGREVYAMCAIDALGIAPMLGQAIEVVSSDPVSEEEVRVDLAADGHGSWQPPEAVVLAGRACEGAAFHGCCHVLNFFASQANAERYLREHEEVRGSPISIPQGVEAGRLIFAGVLEEDAEEAVPRARPVRGAGTDAPA